MVKKSLRFVFGVIPSSVLAVVLLSIARPGEGYTVIRKLIHVWRAGTLAPALSPQDLDDPGGTAVKR